MCRGGKVPERREFLLSLLEREKEKTQIRVYGRVWDSSPTWKRTCGILYLPGAYKPTCGAVVIFLAILTYRMCFYLISKTRR